MIGPPLFAFLFGVVASHLYFVVVVLNWFQGQTSWFLLSVASFVAPSWTALHVCDFSLSFGTEWRSGFLDRHAEGLQQLQHVPPEEVTDGWRAPFLFSFMTAFDFAVLLRCDVPVRRFSLCVCLLCALHFPQDFGAF